MGRPYLSVLGGRQKPFCLFMWAFLQTENPPTPLHCEARVSSWCLVNFSSLLHKPHFSMTFSFIFNTDPSTLTDLLLNIYIYTHIYGYTYIYRPTYGMYHLSSTEKQRENWEGELLIFSVFSINLVTQPAEGALNIKHNIFLQEFAIVDSNGDINRNYFLLNVLLTQYLKEWEAS